jgi:IS30 family transposase
VRLGQQLLGDAGRASRYVMLAKIANRDSRSVVNALIEQARNLPRELYQSLTWDRDKEMAEHSGSRWRPMSRSTSAIRRVLGNAAPTRTPTGY